MIFSPNPQHIHVCNAREEGSDECVERRNLSGSEREGGEEMLKKYTQNKMQSEKMLSKRLHNKASSLCVSLFFDTKCFLRWVLCCLPCCFVNIFNTYLMRCYVVASCLNRSINMKHKQAMRKKDGQRKGEKKCRSSSDPNDVKM